MMQRTNGNPSQPTTAERRAGEMLKEDGLRQKPGEYQKLHHVTFAPKPSLEELGISKTQSHHDNAVSKMGGFIK